MIYFLKDYGISENTINKLSLNPNTVFNIDVNKKDCIEIITLLKSLEIKNIEDIMLYNLNLFFNTKEEVQEMFNKHNIKELVVSINEDFTNIDKLYE